MGRLDDLIYVAKLRINAHREYRKDRRRYVRHTSPEERVMTVGASQRAIETQATKDYHRVEKALALSTVKRPFGEALGARLDHVIPLLEPGSELEQHTTSAREALTLWNEKGIIDEEVTPVVDHTPGDITPDQLAVFFASRHSVRHFDADRPVPRDMLERAVDLASRTPSVCNRQSWRVYFATDVETSARLLKYQNGNRGFGDVPAVALITADARLFAGISERNQGYIDGSLFAMSLVWALHGLGLATCMLNMSVRNDRADALRAAFNIPDHELIIMQVAIGHPAPGFRVARSPRRSRSEITTFL